MNRATYLNGEDICELPTEIDRQIAVAENAVVRLPFGFEATVQ